MTIHIASPVQHAYWQTSKHLQLMLFLQIVKPMHLCTSNSRLQTDVCAGLTAEILSHILVCVTDATTYASAASKRASALSRSTSVMASFRAAWKVIHQTSWLLTLHLIITSPSHPNPIYLRFKYGISSAKHSIFNYKLNVHFLNYPFFLDVLVYECISQF